MPFTDVIGCDAEEAAELYRADGFIVELLDLDFSTVMTMEYRHNRIRLLTRDDRVVRAHHG